MHERFHSEPFSDVRTIRALGGINTRRETLDQLIVGGESGPRARQCNVEWIRSIRDNVKACSVCVPKLFVKQLGTCFTDEKNVIGGCQAKPPPEYGGLHRRLKDRAGADPSEWPEDLRVRELGWRE
jgi:hypothetical protein